jgi:Tol biopolymer transport system component
MFIFIFLLIYAGIIYPQIFGKNKVQYRKFDWKYIQSEHFDIYYYEDNKHLAEFVADVVETSYRSLKKDFRHDIKNRIPILVYSGHNDFEQTNVIYSLIEESVGGFTEIFKDRIVLPFQGSYDEFRHVIHHELTHAVMFQIFYGGGVGSMVTGMARFQIPLWLAEGLAEYESLGWDSQSDMYMRDASLNGYVPPISQMSGFMVYKGGQSLLYYIAEKYGKPKIGEILTKVRLKRNVEQGFKQAIGLDLEELSKRWHKYLRKTYWPDIQAKDEPEDFAKRLTDHSKRKHFLNGSPALSPKGDKLVYLSDRSDFIDIYLMSTIDGRELGRLIKGERSDLFEELHWLRPGMSWSPDGEQIVFAAKAGAKDALYILDIENRKILDSFKFNLDGLFSPNWSPDGKKIAFMGIKGGQSDIYLYYLENEQLIKLTDDIFSDLEPSWSPYSQEIAFISDRSNNIDPSKKELLMQEHNYKNQDLYTIDIETRKITRLTFDSARKQTPAYSPDGLKIAFVSDRNGINNIYVIDKETKMNYAITNLITGVSQISWSRDGSRLAFTSFYDGGYDIYLLNNPLIIEPGSVELQETTYIKKRESKDEKVVDREKKPKRSFNDYQNFIFDERFRKGKIEKIKKANIAFLDTSEYKNAKGEYKTRKYKLRFTPDLITGSAGYSQFWGLQGSSMIALSDILGNHQINIYTDLFYNIKNSNFQFSYFYLPKRIDFGGSIFHFSFPFYTYFVKDGYLYWGYVRDRSYGLSFFLSRPFNRYRRLDFGLTGLGIDRDLVAIDPYYYYGYSDQLMYEMGNLYKRRVLLFNFGYTTDTVLWGMTGPVNGGRSNFRLNYSPSISSSYGLDFWTFRGDWRKYFRILRDYTFALRFAGGFSEGKHPQRFMLGGIQNWINYKYREIPEDIFWEDLFFFSSFETPLRGAFFYEMVGTRFLLANLEFRFPLIRYLIMGWPLPLGFRNIRGVLFFDIGSAWNENQGWKFVDSIDFTLPSRNHILGGYGIGARLNIGFFLLRYDLAYSTDFVSSSKKPVHYFSLGADF